tara:strand:+ start:84 stop:1385 length:1302 start_codon:yes stop_codon:yes gene_type:complete
MSKYILEKIKNRQITVCIIGLGYVGLPLAFRFLDEKIKVIGIDNDLEKLKKIKNGVSYIENKKFKKNNFYKKFQSNISSDYSNAKHVDIIILCLPTPLNKINNPDMSLLNNCVKKLSKHLKKDHTLILESTVYPGATLELFKIINKKKRFSLGKNFYLIFSPERENPGDKSFSYKSTPKVVSGYSKVCGSIGFHLYKLLSKKVHLASSLKVAELSKLLENTYRSVNIGLINEFKIISKKLGVNVWDVINAASTKNFGFRKFNPGPGVGGHCIPIDPLYLSWCLKKKNYRTKIIEISSKLNSAMPIYVSNQIFNYIKKNNIKTKKILFVGIAYKKNTVDTRKSPSVDIIRRFLNKKFKIEFYDPFVKTFDLKNKLFKKKSIPLRKITKYKNEGIVIIGTDHKNLNYKKILKNSKIIFDTRGVYNNYNSRKVIFV